MTRRIDCFVARDDAGGMDDWFVSPGSEDGFVWKKSADIRSKVEP